MKTSDQQLWPLGSRRQLLKGTALLASAALYPTGVLADRLSSGQLKEYPFTLGVASGEPLPDGFVVWTRLVPHVLEVDGGMPPVSFEVTWQVAEDSSFGKIVFSGQAIASPSWGHSVHVEIHGLRSDRPYWYRFMLGKHISPVGKARTTPSPGAEVQWLRACFASCQHYELGYYTAYGHMIADEPDVVFFLGDYIYEDKPGKERAIRSHLNPEPFDLPGYRIRYATYKSDPLLQAAHAAAPWMVIWDDHEVANDYGGSQAEIDTDPAAFLLRRAAAYQAFYEHMPLRSSARPNVNGLMLYRALNWGRLAQFQLLDNRQYRSLRACEAKAAGKWIPDCDELRDPARSLLGHGQDAWLQRTLADSQSLWNVLTQQTVFGPLRIRATPTSDPTLVSRDGWDGFPVSRDRIVARWKEASVLNPIVLGGDIHTFAAGDIYDAESGAVIASEFVGGAITSFGRTVEAAQRVHADNPRFSMFDARQRGFGRLDLSEKYAEITFRRLSNAQDPRSSLVQDAKFVVENGRKGLQRG